MLAHQLGRLGILGWIAPRVGVGVAGQEILKLEQAGVGGRPDSWATSPLNWPGP
jgi:hypothetical protein